MSSIPPQITDFEDKEIDASIDFCYWLLFLPCHFGGCPFKTILLLEKEEVTKTDVDVCGTHVEKLPYGELGSVAKGNCLCCVSARSGVGDFQPGCGCNEERVDEIVSELKARMRARGDTAQILRTEETLKRLDVLDAKIDVILEHLQIPDAMRIDPESR